RCAAIDGDAAAVAVGGVAEEGAVGEVQGAGVVDPTAVAAGRGVVRDGAVGDVQGAAGVLDTASDAAGAIADGHTRDVRSDVADEVEDAVVDDGVVAVDDGAGGAGPLEGEVVADVEVARDVVVFRNAPLVVGDRDLVGSRGQDDGVVGDSAGVHLVDGVAQRPGAAVGRRGDGDRGGQAVLQGLEPRPAAPGGGAAIAAPRGDLLAKG